MKMNRIDSGNKRSNSKDKGVRVEETSQRTSRNRRKDDKRKSKSKSRSGSKSRDKEMASLCTKDSEGHKNKKKESTGELPPKESSGKDEEITSKLCLPGFSFPEIEIGSMDVEQPSISDISSAKMKLSIYSQQPVNSSTKNNKELQASCMDIFNYRVRCFLRSLLHFPALKLFQVICAAFICVMTLKGGLLDSETEVVIDKESEERTEAGVILVNGTQRAIVGETDFQVICILIARLSAWFMYPSKYSPLPYEGSIYE